MAQFVDERCQMFKSQNMEESFFDVTFDIEGKQIRAHKFMLASVSEVLKRMVSDMWNTRETIKIETYSFKDFYEFLVFVYSGDCSIMDGNIFSVADLSEFYQVKELQHKRDEFLSKKQYTKENVLLYLKALSNYSLPMFEKAISKSMKYLSFTESESFMQVSKEIILKIVNFENRIASEEKLFEKIYEWAENRSKKKQSESNEEIYNLNDSIKAELIEILPFIRFKKMKLDFLHKFVVEKDFLFSGNELSEIISFAKANPYVKVTNEQGQSITGMLSNNTEIAENIKSLNNRSPDYSESFFAYWNETKIKAPSIPSQIEKRDGIKWYLYCFNGQISVVRYPIFNSHNLLAEMIPETSDFVITKNCKIEIE
uniref:BTB domain-containing protein n=1 Tax=Panagrolaimus davidi TaxID=227884 RepID=A0A914Q378_9BILA